MKEGQKLWTKEELILAIINEVFKEIVVFGSELVNKIYKREIYLLLNVKEFTFDTMQEKNAFCLGINSAVGWIVIFLSKKWRIIKQI